MADVFHKARAHGRRDTADSLEIQRICSLPLVLDPTPEESEAFCEEEIQAGHFDKGFRLFHTQIGSLLAFDLYGGLFAPVGVGWGKTLITVTVADRAFKRGETERSMLFVPPQVYGQLTKTDIAWVRKRMGIRVPFILMGGRGLGERKSIARSKKKGCYLLPYSLLSTRDSTDMLEAIAPDLLIFDEAHHVKNRNATRTKRLFGEHGYVTHHQPKVAALSGTITSKSIRDYHHLISYALRNHSPLPMSPSLADNWSYVLDAGANPTDAQTGPISSLLVWHRKHFPGVKLPAGVPGLREAYKMRLVTSPGVVATGDAEIGVSLTIENTPVPKHKEAEGFADVARFMSEVEDLWRTPSGDEIDHGFHKWRYLHELSAGFYHNLRWPTTEELMKRLRVNETEAEAFIESAQEHHEARQEYHRQLRRWITYRAKPHMDTPLLIAGNMAQHGARDVGASLFEAWDEMKGLAFEGMPERISEPVRLCDYKVRHAAEWASKVKGGALIWYHHKAVGRWAVEIMKQEGIDAVWCPSESEASGANDRILDPANGNRILVASMGGHGTGKNLQHFQQQHFLQWPRRADLIEQVLGRTHRNGQEAEELLPSTNNTLEFDHLNLAACLVDALYIHQTTGSRQKVIYANWNPLPKMFPDDFLRERGFADMKQLDSEQRSLLAETFGVQR